MVHSVYGLMTIFLGLVHCHVTPQLFVFYPYSANRENKKYVLWNAGICPIDSKVGHVTLATPPFGVIRYPLYTTSNNGSNRENKMSLASAV